jgi:hypothetical protein
LWFLFACSILESENLSLGLSSGHNSG